MNRYYSLSMFTERRYLVRILGKPGTSDVDCVIWGGIRTFVESAKSTPTCRKAYSVLDYGVKQGVYELTANLEKIASTVSDCGRVCSERITLYSYT